VTVPSIRLFERLYRYFARRRMPLFAVTLLVVGLGAFASSRAHIEEDIVSMLPDDHSDVSRDFHLLQLAPFTRKIVITLNTKGNDDPAALTEAADRLAAALTREGIGKVTTGPTDVSGNFFGWMGAALPSLVNEQDLQKIAAATTPAEVKKRLTQNYERLISPEGLALKETIQSDPLSLSTIALEKMRFLNLIPNMRLVNNHFVSADGRSALVVVDSSVGMTDAAGSRDLISRIDRGIAASLPKGISATVLSGHRYTLANAGTIKHDLYLVLIINTVAVLAIYVVFLRSLSSIFVFLVPSSILLIASGLTAATQGNVFALTLGFGGVLLGIADEYAMLVYFSCRMGGKDHGLITAEVSRPVLFGAAGTLVSFGVMMLSTLPGQRQLAFYSMTGIVASLIISLIVLPHLIPEARQGRLPLTDFGSHWKLPRRAVLGVWLVLLALCGWQATKVRFNGDLRAINFVPPELHQAEEEVKHTWGDMRGKALIFSEGKDIESALALNDRVFRTISAKLPAGELVSLAPVLPSAQQQQENRRRWVAFWGGGRAERLAADLSRESAALGFASDAFAPFIASLKNPSPDAATVDGLKAAGMGELVDSMIVRSPGVVRVLTLIPDAPQVVTALSQDLKALPGVHVVSQTLFGDNLGRAIDRDFTRYMTLTSILVFALVVLLFRRPKRIMLVLVPVATGLVCMLGIMGMLGLEFNIFNIAATILIIGLCVDYGIFMICKLTEGSNHAANRAVLVSGLTTLAGLGSLAVASHPSMHSIGITVLLGIGTGIPTALFVIPALLQKESA
jgi:uncharacterized protein